MRRPPAIVPVLVAAMGLVVIVGAASCKKSQSPVTMKCIADSDCAFACAARGDCCPNPCSCSIPVHRDEKNATESFNRDKCSVAEVARCPTVGACAPLDPSAPELVPRCRAGVCIGETQPRTSSPSSSSAPAH